MSTYEAEARRIVEKWFSDDTPDENEVLYELIAAALAAAHAKGREDGIEEAAKVVQTYDSIDIYASQIADDLRALARPAQEPPSPPIEPGACAKCGGPFTPKALIPRLGLVAHSSRCTICGRRVCLSCHDVAHRCPFCTDADLDAWYAAGCPIKEQEPPSPSGEGTSRCTCAGVVPWHETGCPRESEWTPEDAADALTRQAKRGSAPGDARREETK